MKPTIAFCLYKYFPFGGLQRDFLHIAKACQARGCHIRVYTLSWQGEQPTGFEIIQVPVKARSNHSRNTQYSAWVKNALAQYPANIVVGFNKMPNLDIYYAADVCYAEKTERSKGWLYRLTPRYHHYMEFERAVFAQGQNTQLLMLTNNQIAEFKKHYHTESARFHILPPGISRDRKYDQQIAHARQTYREKNHITAQQKVVLQVGSDFTRKGVDRTLQAIAALPNDIAQQTLYLVIGQDRPARYQKLAQKLNISEQVHFFPGRDDIMELMAAADVLIHPAYQEAAGIVLLEAIAAGLPIITTDVCGYAPYITQAKCGIVIPEPFQQQSLNQALQKALSDTKCHAQWIENAKHYADTQDLYSLPEKAADIILGRIHG